MQPFAAEAIRRTPGDFMRGVDRGPTVSARTGSLAFDNDAALVDRPRRNASVVVGTAASHRRQTVHHL